MRHPIIRRLRRLVRLDDGPTAVEYAVMLALIVLVCLASIRTVGFRSRTTFTRTARSLAS